MIVATVIDLLKAEPSVAALLADRVYPDTAPDAPTYPLAVVTKVSGIGQYDLAGDVGVEDARVEVDLYADTGKAVVLACRTAVRRFLSGFQGGLTTGSCVIQTCMCINDFDLPEVSTERGGPRLRRRLLEFRGLEHGGLTNGQR